MSLNFFYKIFNGIKSFIIRALGAKSVGARALVVKNDEVLLIRHTYQKGWCTIGGAVERGESPRAAVVRELMEEAGVIVLEKPDLFAIYHSNSEKRDDYVAFYIIKDFEMLKNSYSREVAEKKWFSLSQLPPDITPSTLKRIEEYLEQREKSEKW